MTETSGSASTPVDRTLDMVSLKALAHPLRVQILDTLSTYGQFTASGLAERLGESSGATSYHLRQLERHGFVREVAGKGSGRERWWERMPGGITLNALDIEDTHAAREAERLVMRQWSDNRYRLLRDFEENATTNVAEHWIRSSSISTINLRLTAEQLKALGRDFETLIDSYVERFRGQDVPGSRPVQVQFNAFPVLDGEETPDPSDDGGRA